MKKSEEVLLVQESVTKAIQDILRDALLCKTVMRIDEGLSILATNAAHFVPAGHRLQLLGASSCTYRFLALTEPGKVVNRTRRTFILPSCSVSR